MNTTSIAPGSVAGGARGPAAAPAGGRRYRFGFAIEYTIGNVTLAKALQKLVAQDNTIEAEWYLVEPEGRGFPAGVPPFSSNYTLRTSATARRLVGRGAGLDALLLHTQTLGLFFPRLMGRLPAVISTDATPKNIDEIGAAYRHPQSGPVVSELKRRLTGALLRRAACVMPWSEWARRSLVEDYGVAEDRCQVVLPGVDVQWWGAGARAPVARAEGRPLRVVFVGADFERKGGPDLLAAAATLNAGGVAVECHIVTKADVPAAPMVQVYRDLGQGDGALRDLVASADVFVLPTRGDAAPWALLEAMAAGAPVVSTRLAAIPEIVKEGETGLLVPPGDPAALASALRTLAGDTALRLRMGATARRVAQEHYDLAVNGHKVLTLLKSVARAAQGGK